MVRGKKADSEKGSTLDKVENKAITKKKGGDDSKDMKRPLPPFMMWYKSEASKKLVHDKYKKKGLKAASAYFRNQLDPKVREEFEKTAKDARAKWQEMEQDDD